MNFYAYEYYIDIKRGSKHPKHLIENPTVCTNKSLNAYISLDTCNYVLCAGGDLSPVEY